MKSKTRKDHQNTIAYYIISQFYKGLLLTIKSPTSHNPTEYFRLAPFNAENIQKYEIAPLHPHYNDNSQCTSL